MAACLPACRGGEIRERHASLVDFYLPTPGLDEAGPAWDPNRALGPPDGRTVALAEGSALVVRFFRPIPDGAGADLRVVEIGASDGAVARIAASEDGATFREFATLAGAARGTLFDLAELGLDGAAFVRVRGLDPVDDSDDPGFDLDAMEALH